jgi:hypothetical protein
MVAARRDSALGLFGRGLWMIGGPAALLASTVVILSSPQAGWRTRTDIVFWIALAAMIVGRLLEHFGGDPRTSMGEPATSKDLWRYLAVTSVACVLVWLVANTISNHLLG